MLPRKAYIHPSAVRTVNIEATGIEVWEYNDSRLGKPCAVVFHGRKQKPDWNYRFDTEQARAKKIKAYLESLASWQQSKKEQRTRLSEPTSLQVGDILHGSWGYDQTQCDYFQVTGRKGKRGVYVRKIAAKTVPGSEGHMSAYLLPVKDQFLNEIETFHLAVKYSIRYDPGEYYERNPEYPYNRTAKDRHYTASKWSGSANYSSWYA